MIKTAFELKTIGRLLKEKRKSKDLSFDAISEIIKINPEYLEALENANYAKFPSEVYIKGFLRNYSRFLGIDPNHALALYRREQENSISSPSIKVVDKIRNKGFDLTINRKRLLTLLVIVLIISSIIYIGTNVFNVFQEPNLKLEKPISLDKGSSGEYISNTDSITLEGLSDIGNKLVINGHEYRVNSFEQFNVDIKLQKGKNNILLSAQNQFNRKSEISLFVFYEPKDTDVSTSLEENIQEAVTPISARIEIIAEGAYLEIKTDGQLKEDRLFPVNEILNFSAEEVFELFTPRIESINLFINNELQTISSQRIKYQVIDGKVSKIKP